MQLHVFMQDLVILIRFAHGPREMNNMYKQKQCTHCCGIFQLGFQYFSLFDPCLCYFGWNGSKWAASCLEMALLLWLWDDCHQGWFFAYDQGGLSSEKKYLGLIFFPSPGGEPTYHIIRHITIYGNSHDMPIVEMYQDYLLHGFLWLISASMAVYLCLVVYICTYWTYYNKSQTFIAWIKLSDAGTNAPAMLSLFGCIAILCHWPIMHKTPVLKGG